MSFDRLKNLFSRTFDPKEEDSLVAQATTFISSSRRTIIQNPTAEFHSYLASLPLEDLRQLRATKRPSRTASLKPQMVKQCYERVPPVYFDAGYAVGSELFIRSRKEAGERNNRMQEWLDEVELCLFNQISSRFDEILSVLRTIESLECIVVFNARRLRAIREGNMRLSKEVSSRHMRIVTLLRRQQHLREVLAPMAQMRAYRAFLTVDESELRGQKSNAQHYQAIADIRGKRELYFQLAATRHFEERLEQFQTSLKRSYSDSVNDALFRYAAHHLPYDPRFWERKFAGRLVFEEEQKEQDGTVILDESVLAEEEQPGYKVGGPDEQAVIDNILGGWRDGEYSAGSLRGAVQKLVRERHLRFLNDFRGFAFQTHVRLERKKIENPSLANLLRAATIPFCTKTFTYYADMFHALLLRAFSVVARAMAALAGEREGNTMEERERQAALVEGLMSFLGFLFKLVYERVVQVVDLKEVHEAMELADFRQIIAVYENEEEFIQKELKRLLQVLSAQGEGNKWLWGLICGHAGRIQLSLLGRAKREKVERFLNGTHGYILQNQLRESFENEVWQATDIPTFYYDSLHFLITGESLNLRRTRAHNMRHSVTQFESSVFVDRLQESRAGEQRMAGDFRIIRSEIIVEGRSYKVTETLLLLLEIVEDYMHVAQLYPFVAQEVGVKVYELLKAYNTSSHQLIVLGGAVKLGKIRTKNITAKHLALDSLCLSFLLYLLPRIAQRLPLYEHQRMRRDLQTHQETAIKKLSSILVGKINQALPDINLNSTPTKGTEFIVNNTKVLHDILADFYSRDTLALIFTPDNLRAYLSKLRTIEIRTKLQAESLKDDLNFYFHELKFLDKIIPEYTQLRLEGEDLIRAKFEDL